MDYSINDLKGFLHGLAWFGVEDYELTRFPTSAKPKLDPGLWEMARMPSGARIRFNARCDVLVLDVDNFVALPSPRMAQIAICGFDVYADGEYIDSFVPPIGKENHFLGMMNVDGSQPHDYEIYFPYCSPVKLAALAIESRARSEDPTITPYSKPFAVPYPIVFYGSSITHGASADRPGITYPALIARALNFDFINMGFGGSGKGEPAVADLLASIPNVGAYVLDWGINLCSPQEVNLIHDRYHPLLKKVKKAHPDVPVLIVNLQDAGPKVDKTMPVTLEIIRKEIKRVYDAEIAAGNDNLWYVDGRDIIGGPKGFDLTIDRVHPHQGGFYRYAEKLTPVIKDMLGL
nr:SGNH/GDSL hydrolase family protein [Candidatus Sigynarchaeota archaeon]